MDRETVLRRGAAAAKILSDESVMLTFGEIEAELFTNWAETNPINVDGREAIYRQIKALELFQTKLESLAANAKVEQSNMERTARDRKGQQVEA